MDPGSVRYQVTATLLRAKAPLTLAELVCEANLPRQALLGALWALIEEGDVLEGALDPDRPGPQYAWASRRDPGDAGDADIEGELVRAFHDFVIRDYRPPGDKRILVFFQCAVRRPFSKAPSHASLRRAVSVATGHDPAREFDACPVHVVVLASLIGPVPYELEEFYPANLRCGGVKHFGNRLYERVRPILAERMVEYLEAHGKSYDHVAAFTQGRYAEVMRDAQAIAAVDFPIFPDYDGPAVLTLRGKPPRSYWEKYWIQLCEQLVEWLPSLREAADRRLADLEVVRR